MFLLLCAFCCDIFLVCFLLCALLLFFVAVLLLLLLRFSTAVFGDLKRAVVFCSVFVCCVLFGVCALLLRVCFCCVQYCCFVVARLFVFLTTIT